MRCSARLNSRLSGGDWRSSGVLHTYPVALGLLRRRSLLVEQQLPSRPTAIKKLRLIPAEKAYALARKFQGRFGTTVSVH